MTGVLDGSGVLVVMSLESWDSVWRRNQHLVDGLLRSFPALRVVFVEPSNDVAYTIARGRRPQLGAGLRAADGYGGRLALFQPTKWLPRMVGPWADDSLRRQLLRALRAVGADGSGVIWINDPGWSRLVEWNRFASVYDVTDDWLRADRGAREHDALISHEARLLAAADAVVVCSTGLVATKRAQRPNLELIPNAVDVAAYRADLPRPADLPATLTAIYVGTLHEDRLDVELCVQTARAVAAIGGRCVLVGPNALSPQNTARIAAEVNVDLMGPRPYRDVPAYICNADVLIVPHRVDGFTESLDPIKLYEYRAAGRPVVSTRVAGFRDEDGPRVSAVEAADFAATVVERMLRPPAIEHIAAPDWSERVTDFARVLRELP